MVDGVAAGGLDSPSVWAATERVRLAPRVRRSFMGVGEGYRLEGFLPEKGERPREAKPIKPPGGRPRWKSVLAVKRR